MEEGKDGGVEGWKGDEKRWKGGRIEAQRRIVQAPEVRKVYRNPNENKPSARGAKGV